MLHNRYLIPGGEEQSCAAEVTLLRDYGHEVELMEEDNRRVEQLGKARTALNTVWSRESYRRIDEKLRYGNFDILHVQNFFPSGLHRSTMQLFGTMFPWCRLCTTIA